MALKAYTEVALKSSGSPPLYRLKKKKGKEKIIQREKLFTVDFVNKQRKKEVET